MVLSLGGWEGERGRLKVSPPPMKFSLKATLPPPKMAFLKKFLTFLAKKCHFFQKILGTSRDYHKSAVKFFKFFDTSPPLKIFLNPYPPPKIFGQAHALWYTQ
jgi:hypothetical protein